MFENLDPDAAIHLGCFIDSFVEARKRERWRSVLSMKPSKWVGASAYDVSVPQLPISANAAPEQILAKLDLGSDVDKDAFVFSLGHSHGQAYRSTLRETILGDEGFSESVVSIVPGKLAVALGHSGEVFLCGVSAV